ncbi:hypothetical protein FQA39_LY12432 [Lamprigera yunnana]|nr:hypothetical protein FQA39_LY12432 [Lamprigera yunnana]
MGDVLASRTPSRAVTDVGIEDTIGQFRIASTHMILHQKVCTYEDVYLRFSAKEEIVFSEEKIKLENENIKYENENTELESRIDILEKETRKKKIIVQGIREIENDSEMDIKDEMRKILNGIDVDINMGNEMKEARRIRKNCRINYTKTNFDRIWTLE